jgi:hypothetical protein
VPRVPSRSFSVHIAGGQAIACLPRELGLQVWQAHVIKHPFGLRSLMTPSLARDERVWTTDGWHETSPPVITPELRREMAAAIVTLRDGEASCRVPRLTAERFRGEVPPDWEACYRCPDGLARACSQITEPVGDAYRDVIDATIAALDGDAGEVIGRGDLAPWLWPSRGADLRARAARLDGLAVMTFGWRRTREATLSIARVNRWDGIRTDFYFDQRGLVWRTTYRVPPRNYGHLVGFLLQYAELPPHPAALSDIAVVPRQWSNASGFRS